MKHLMNKLIMDNSKTIQIKFIVNCNETNVGDKLFIIGENNSIITEVIEMQTYPNYFPFWESHLLSLQIKTASSMKFSIYIKKLDLKIIDERIGMREIELSKFVNNKLYICQYEFNLSDPICIDEIKLSYEMELFEFNICRRCHEEDTLKFLEIIKSNYNFLDIKQIIIKSKRHKDKIPDIYLYYEKDLSLVEISRIVLYRLTVLLQNENKYKFVIPHTTLLSVMGVYKEIFDNYENEEFVKFYLCLILHCSRAFVDPDLSSLVKINEVLQNNLTRVSTIGIYSMGLILKKDLHHIVYQTINLLRKIYKSDKFRLGLRKFIIKYYNKVKYLENEIDNAIQFFENNIEKIKFVKNGYFNGMCGIGGEIYVSMQNIIEQVLDKEEKENILDKIVKKCQIYLILTIIHENSHSLLREVLIENWLQVPNKAKIDNGLLECGYDFEQMIFGNVIGDYNYAQNILTINNWKFLFFTTTNHLLTQQDIDNQKESAENLYTKLNGLFCSYLSN